MKKEKSRNEKIRNRGWVIDNEDVANCHIKNRPTAISKFIEDTRFLEIIRIFITWHGDYNGKDAIESRVGSGDFSKTAYDDGLHIPPSFDKRIIYLPLSGCRINKDYRSAVAIEMMRKKSVK
ncbi:MAG: hypothetical protein IJK85_04385 [Bacteroidales bacterium]|nr:hypothetical protein [Bacteroidales bacterium]